MLQLTRLEDGNGNPGHAYDCREMPAMAMAMDVIGMEMALMMMLVVALVCLCLCAVVAAAASLATLYVLKRASTRRNCGTCCCMPWKNRLSGFFL